MNPTKNLYKSKNVMVLQFFMLKKAAVRNIYVFMGIKGSLIIRFSIYLVNFVDYYICRLCSRAV
jgi:hypothetical protein